MTIRPRRRRPAPGQTVFRWLLADPPMFLEPIAPVARRPVTRRPRRIMLARPRRPVLARPRPSEEAAAATAERFLRRRAGCALCGSWPATRDHWIGGRLLLLCKPCDGEPSAWARLAELVAVDWRPEPRPRAAAMM
jgi:hypothetical protein